MSLLSVCWVSVAQVCCPGSKMTGWQFVGFFFEGLLRKKTKLGTQQFCVWWLLSGVEIPGATDPSAWCAWGVGLWGLCYWELCWAVRVVLQVVLVPSLLILQWFHPPKVLEFHQVLVPLVFPNWWPMWLQFWIILLFCLLLPSILIIRRCIIDSLRFTRNRHWKNK